MSNEQERIEKQKVNAALVAVFRELQGRATCLCGRTNGHAGWIDCAEERAVANGDTR